LEPGGGQSFQIIACIAASARIRSMAAAPCVVGGSAEMAPRRLFRRQRLAGDAELLQDLAGFGGAENLLDRGRDHAPS
jgi:hypothetical protein